MNSEIISLIILGCLAGAVLAGRELRRFLPEDHLSADSKDAVKLAMGLVATMAALLLGLLVSSAKGSYDTVRNEVIQMAAKVSFLDRVLTVYGPDAAEARVLFRKAAEELVRRMWPQESRTRAQLAPDTQAGGGARLSMLVLRDDATQEYAYGPAAGLPETHVGAFTQALYDKAKKDGWTVISMKDGWKKIFAFEPWILPRNPKPKNRRKRPCLNLTTT